ncbi:hypothetical protein AB5J72_07450 [Streptomyces sp. CG1]|uniref:hypothetical protein n=1 Tax=Streptomyces sp. CG1 TaxID=1287523 RepID=UPI0034E1EFBA
MAAWLWRAWLQVWPNLAANVIWVPVVGVHHWLTRLHLRALHERQCRLHHLVEQKEGEGQST